MPALAAATALAAVCAHRRAAAVFDDGPLLDAVQRARLFDDAKHFVDMPLRQDPEEVLAAFSRLSPPERADCGRLRAFVEEFFEPPGVDLEPHRPREMPAEPPFFASAGGVRDPELREFALALHRFWPVLCKVTAREVEEAPQRHTLLPRRHPIVLPGGRFREAYYWDSLWIVLGLLASGLVQLAKGVVQNHMDDVARFGFVPNGGRSYYLNRSQPPVLAEMVATVARALPPAEAEAWLPQAVATLRREYEWWMGEERVVCVGGTRLNRFYAHWHKPRPESYWNDIEAAEKCSFDYNEVASAAETGWDFSVRWTRPQPPGCDHHFPPPPLCKGQMHTTEVVPICLNAFMYRMERDLAALSEAVATRRSLSDVEAARAAGRSLCSPDAVRFQAAAEARRAAIGAFFWRPHLGRWVDLWLPAAGAAAGSWSREDVQRAIDQEGYRYPTLADFAPALWAGLASPAQAEAAMEALEESGLVGVAGVATSTFESGEQWDAPNAWAPLQSMLIDGLRRSGAPGSERMAADVAQRWVGTCYAAWRDTGVMHEKYNAHSFGRPGAGGEYTPQLGFGWTNGVALDLLATYGQELRAPRDWRCSETRRAASCDGGATALGAGPPPTTSLPGAVPELRRGPE